MGGGGAELVLRIEGDGALWSVMADWRRDRVKDLAMGEVWAEAVISEWLGSHGHEAEAAALMSPEEAAFWYWELRAMRDTTAEMSKSLELGREAGCVRESAEPTADAPKSSVLVSHAILQQYLEGTQGARHSIIHDIYCRTLYITHCG